MRTGGCPKTEAVRRDLARLTAADIGVLPSDPQIAGALGAALYARDRALAVAA